ncbi:MAG: hypothetical protein LBC77_00045 [Spirochaetaceae bacterium]|jgi:hypothetical protein|nr:hypothetical protein [Spirochaetaceae bacterium]
MKRTLCLFFCAVCLLGGVFAESKVNLKPPFQLSFGVGGSFIFGGRTAAYTIPSPVTAEGTTYTLLSDAQKEADTVARRLYDKLKARIPHNSKIALWLPESIGFISDDLEIILVENNHSVFTRRDLEVIFQRTGLPGLRQCRRKYRRRRRKTNRRKLHFYRKALAGQRLPPSIPANVKRPNRPNRYKRRGEPVEPARRSAGNLTRGHPPNWFMSLLTAATTSVNPRALKHSRFFLGQLCGL